MFVRALREAHLSFLHIAPSFSSGKLCLMGADDLVRVDRGGGAFLVITTENRVVLTPSRMLLHSVMHTAQEGK